MGARKFLINNIGAVGCTPGFLNTFKPTTPCIEPVNEDVQVFNAILSDVLTNLQAELPGSRFVVSNSFKLCLDIQASPAA